MDHEDIKKMQEGKSLEVINKRKEYIDAEMKRIRQQEKEQDKIFLKELPDEEREEIFMMLQ